MKAISISKVRPGMILGRALYDEGGRVLLKAQVPLSEAYLNSLRAKGYTRLYIKDTEVDFDVEPDEDISPLVRAKAAQALRDTFDKISEEVYALRRQSQKDILGALSSERIRVLVGPDGPLTSIKSVVDNILQEVLFRASLAGLTSIKSADSHLFDHSIDVCVVAIMIGKAIGLPSSSLSQLAAGCLLHDIGLLFIERGDDERQRVRQHTLLGYELLKGSEEGGDILAPHIALEHHEHQDGSGQPRGLVGSNTIERNRTLPPPIPSLTGEIAAIANVYDNLLSGSATQPPLATDETIATIRKMAGTQLNREVVSSFLRIVPVYPLGVEVIVRGGVYTDFMGIVSRVSDTQVDKPVVTLVRDSNGKPIEPELLDLAEHADVSIVCINQ